MILRRPTPSTLQAKTGHASKSLGMRVAMVVGLLVLAVVSGPAGARAASDDMCSDVRVPLRMFKVEAKWKDASVRVGDVAELDVTVTRTAEEDPVSDDGIPYPTGRPMNEPAEGVELGVRLLVGDYFLSTSGLTDADGKATAKVKILSYVEPGSGRPGVYAEKLLTPKDFPTSACRLLVFEWGYLEAGPKLQVTR